MKLRHQGVLLLGIAVTSQLLFATLLITTLITVNSAARREFIAKQVITSCQSIRVNLLSYVRNIAAHRFVQIGDLADSQEDFQRRIAADLAVMKELVKNDPESKELAEQYGRDLKTATDLVQDALRGYQAQGTLYFARFVNDQEYMEELSAAMNKSSEIERRLTHKYAPVVAELRPESLEKRDNLLKLTIGGVALNSIAVSILAWLLGKRVLARLAILMNNIEKFGKSRPELTPVGGSDELADIDHAFRQMSAARDGAEEMRRSLFAMVSHDLRSPLTSIGVSIDMTMEVHGNNLPSGARTGLGKVHREIQRLLRLANAFLDLEKIEEGKLELYLDRASADEVVTPALDAVRGIADAKRVKLISDCNPETELICDVERLVQIMVNLLSNSIRFTPPDSTIRVVVSQINGATKFSVFDQGPGMTQEEQHQLFQKFSQLEQQRNQKKLGTGLGLYICKMLVEAHKGTIGCYCPEEGTCFWFEIPNGHQNLLL